MVERWRRACCLTPLRVERARGSLTTEDHPY
jgi:hypothetical protein